MDIIFNHRVALTSLCNGEHKRLNFSCQQKVPVTIVGEDSTPNRSHYDFELSDGTILKAVPASVFRFDEVESTRSTSKAKKSTSTKTVATK